jgi:hypothetical protein
VRNCARLMCARSLCNCRRIRYRKKIEKVIPLQDYQVDMEPVG